MKYCMVEGGVIANVIECADDATAAALNAKPYIEGFEIGARYPDEQELIQRHNRLMAQLAAVSDRQEFLEDCIAEIGMEVYQ